MATFMPVPIKRTWEVDLEKPLTTFITNTYSSCEPEDYKTGIVEFNKLRNNMIAKSFDKHESSLEVLYRYYDQLCAIESKFPIAENQIRVNFKWQDSFDKESFFAGKRTLSIASSQYEQVCILFNIAALQSQIAVSQNHTSDDGLKMAAKLFQQSSGIFSHLKDCVLSHVQNDPTPDLCPDTLTALCSLMLAQGQDCFVRKAMQDKMKPAIVAKLANQCCDFYADAMKLVQLDSIRGLWPKDWIPSTASKQAAYHSLSEYYQSLQAKEKKDFGEEIARLKHAKDLMAAAETRGGSAFIHGNYQKKIVRSLEEAMKDNDFIYHAKVPELSSLSATGKAAVAKSLPLNTPLSPSFTDLFAKVVPLAVHNALAGFDNRKTELVNGEVGRLRESTQLMNGVLVSMNLPAAIEDLSGAKVPASVLEKASKVREKGGFEAINRTMVELPELLQRNKEILDEAEKCLNEEQESDKQLRTQFKERWTRTQSDSLTGPLRSEAGKYRQIITNAINADGIVRERYGKHKGLIELLSKSDGDIERALPSASPVAALQGSPVVSELRGLMEQVEAIKAEREVMEHELKETKCDVSSKFLAALAQDGAINEDMLSAEELDRIYSGLRNQVSESIHKQEALLANVERANNAFVSAKSQGQSGATREEFLKNLATAYDNFTELKSNLDEGTKFYNDLTQLLVKFQSKVNDFVFARKTEKEELMKDLQSTIVRQQSAPPPAAPSYQQPTVSTPAVTKTTTQPPARPPPPNVATGASAPPPQAPPSAQAPAPPTYGAAPYPAYGQMPYPPAPAQAPYPAAGGYAPPPMPQGYNPYGYPPQQPPAPAQYPQQGQGYPQQHYPSYPGYPQQQWGPRG